MIKEGKITSRREIIADRAVGVFDRLIESGRLDRLCRAIILFIIGWLVGYLQFKLQLF